MDARVHSMVRSVDVYRAESPHGYRRGNSGTVSFTESINPACGNGKRCCSRATPMVIINDHHRLFIKEIVKHNFSALGSKEYSTRSLANAMIISA
jgi:hypothetical protein